MRWFETISQRRLAKQVTQKDLAVRLSITREHLSRIERGTRNASPALQELIDETLDNWSSENELFLQFDYVRLRFPTADYQLVIDEVLGIQREFMAFEDWAFNGYSAQYVFSNIVVMVSLPHENLGTLVELKGQGCREMEGLLLKQDRTWYDFFQQCLAYNVTFKRLDLAINDTVGLLSIPELIKKCERNECISVLRNYQGIRSGGVREEVQGSHGATLYLGSMRSEIYFCVYEKAYEQAQKKGIAVEDVPVKNRFEIRLKNARAEKAVEDLLSFRNVEQTAFGIITRYVRFVDQKPNMEREDWPINPRWAYFCGQNRLPLRLTIAPEPFDLNLTRNWIRKQVAPMLKVLFEIDAFHHNSDTLNMINNIELEERHEQLIEQYTVGREKYGDR
ncbi:XRE family transcriptional regulator [Furfurilactobacillus milii]|uniref:Helix-turn-helix domain-containing protein n=1 Tax=Furfurilactobacillus milii TaxID=2888272 RepID=A0A6N9HZV4_9LACO|nr:XRE family transcriptional regulator [Furfurilactobacillus milii]MYV16064.1 helix-turn-helix domain-containing protein [Furfurilactobacillus milii]